MGRAEVDQSQQWLRPAEAAEMLGVAATTVSAWARKGTLPSFVTPGGQRRFRRGDVEQLLAEGLAVDTDREAS